MKTHFHLLLFFFVCLHFGVHAENAKQGVSVWKIDPHSGDKEFIEVDTIALNYAFADKNRCFKAVGLFNVCNLVVYFCNFSATNSVEVAHDVSNFHNFFSLMCTKLSNLRQEI